MKNYSVQLLTATVGHRRAKPASNMFTYKVYYTRTPITPDMQLGNKPWLFSCNRWNVFSLYNRDHGARNNTSLHDWALALFAQHRVTIPSDHTLHLIAHPRLLGYAFNPISYWLLQDSEKNTVAVICEVHNTFGGDHSYVLANPDDTPITADNMFTAEKKLFVSPFNKVEGYYEFIFDVTQDTFESKIDYYKDTDDLTLETYMKGHYRPLTSWAILRSLIHYPLMALMVVGRIHYQAVKLYFKKVPNTLSTRPAQNNQTSSTNIH